MDIMLARILELIGKKHGSAQELVKAIGLSKNAVTEWKSGRSVSYKKHAPQIAEFYGVSLDWLSGLSDEKEQKEKSTPVSKGGLISEISDLASQLTPEHQRLILAQIKGILSNRE